MKQLVRFCCLMLGFYLIGLWLLTPTVHAKRLLATEPITVTTLSDGIADDGLCSLREAIIAANTDRAFHDCPSGSGADTIRFALTLAKPTIFTLTQSGAGENSAYWGDLDITGTLTISGTNATTPGVDSIVIDGNDSDRVFELRPGAQVAMVGVTIQHGNPGAAVDGGGVLVDLTARLTLSNSQIISNSAWSGGGLKVLGRLTMDNSEIVGNQGGGIHNDGGLVTLHNVQVRNNRRDGGIRNQAQGALSFHTGLVSANQGGGIVNAAATATLSNLSIVSNTEGSGVANTGAILSHVTISHSQILSNSAISGGGVLNEGVGALVNVNATRISGNRTTSNGGGLFNNGIMAIDGSTVDHNHGRAGGGLYHFGGNLSLTNATVSQNSATDNGGGLYNGAAATLTFVTVNGNQASGEGGNLLIDEAALSVANSIIANAATGGNCVNNNGFLTSLGHNLESANSCNFNATGDLLNLDPLLGPLQDNSALGGGLAWTHALLPGSPAIDQGSIPCPSMDQRGVTRPQGFACDIGAYEFTPLADLAMVTSLAPATVTVGAIMTYTLRVSNLGPMTATALTLVDQLSENVTFLTATLPVAGGDCIYGPSITCTLARLDAGLSVTITIVVSAPLSAGLITNTASISATTPDLNLANNRVVNLTSVVPRELAPPPHLVQIQIEPAMPTTQDIISITVSGVYTSSCTPQYQAHQRTEHLIAIQSIPSPEIFCLPAEFPWGYTIAVGPLAAGVYTVTHTLQQITETAQFTVTGAPLLQVDDTQAHAATVGALFRYIIKASGTPPLTYALVQGPPGMNIDPSTGQLTWTPTTGAVGDVTVTVRAMNTLGQAEVTFQVTVYYQSFLPFVANH